MSNIPNPDLNTFEVETNKQSGKDKESNSENQNTDKIPVPPDVQRDQIPIEEPPTEKEKAPIEDDGGDKIKRIV